MSYHMPAACKLRTGGVPALPDLLELGLCLFMLSL